MNPSRPEDTGLPAEQGTPQVPPADSRSGEGADSALQRLKELERRLPAAPDEPPR